MLDILIHNRPLVLIYNRPVILIQNRPGVLILIRPLFGCFEEQKYKLCG